MFNKIISGHAVKNIALIFAMIFSATSVYSQQGVGKQLAQDAMALVGYLELSNIGSRDLDCKGTPFEITNVNFVIETDIRDLLIKIAAIDNKIKSNEIDEMVAALKQIPMASKDGKYALQAAYEKAKKDNFSVYGKQGGCASLSASFRTVVQQRKLSIKNFINK